MEERHYQEATQVARNLLRQRLRKPNTPFKRYPQETGQWEEWLEDLLIDLPLPWIIRYFAPQSLAAILDQYCTPDYCQKILTQGEAGWFAAYREELREVAAKLYIELMTPFDHEIVTEDEVQLLTLRSLKRYHELALASRKQQL